jgi:hypothetical protein
MTTFAITSAAYANAAHTSAIIHTEDAGDVLVSVSDTPELWEQLAASGLQIGDFPFSDPAEELKRTVSDKTQKRLDTFAQSRNYDNILSACTYATSTIPKFQREGQYCVEARDATWNKLYEIMEAVQAGTRQMPSGYAEVEPELPVLAWPDESDLEPPTDEPV